MTRGVFFQRIALREFDEAVAWYEAERVHLGVEFRSAIDEALSLAAKNPLAFRRVRGPVRRVVVKRFPYTIHFIDEESRIVVLAIYHAARDPSALRQRQ